MATWQFRQVSVLVLQLLGLHMCMKIKQLMAAIAALPSDWRRHPENTSFQNSERRLHKQLCTNTAPLCQAHHQVSRSSNERATAPFSSSCCAPSFAELHCSRNAKLAISILASTYQIKNPLICTPHAKPVDWKNTLEMCDKQTWLKYW